MIINEVDLGKLQMSDYQQCYVGCVVLTKDHQIVLQQRGDDWHKYPGFLAEFGGRIEYGETPVEALVRELNEELGAIVEVDDIVCLGAVTEELSNFSELIYVYFWFDRHGTITGCYEGECRYYDNIDAALRHPKMMESVRWLLNQCHAKKLIP